MAQRTTVVMTDDLNGEEDESVRTRKFAVDGVDYEIDLDEDNSAEFDDLLAVYIENARRAGGRKQQPKTTKAGTRGYNRETSRAIRQWALREGYELSDRGRVPHVVIDAWEKAHLSAAA